MVDGAVLLVDAVEGPLAQTKFVLAKALSRGLAPVVVLNKVDRPAVTQSRCDAVASQLFDLFHSLGADDRQLDFPILYASAKQVCPGFWVTWALGTSSLYPMTYCRVISLGTSRVTLRAARVTSRRAPHSHRVSLSRPHALHDHLPC